MITDSDIENWFQYHAPSPEQQVHYGAIREGARKFAFILLNNTPMSADQTAAFRLLRECVMTANASIACNE
jgi:hypothetical protein